MASGPRSGDGDRQAAPVSPVMWLLAGGMVLAALWWMVRADGLADFAPRTTSPAVAMSPADARQQEILKASAGRPTDPELAAVFETINQRHFTGQLPPVTVRWEPALADVGTLAGQAFTLEGMFGRTGKELFILLNPGLRNDTRAIARALCHEMVHAYLASTGDATTTHGAAFKAVLQRLASEGAFEGTSATEEEKVSLRAWLDAESNRLEAERREMDVFGGDIARERAELDRALAEHNARAAAAQASGQPGPTPVETLDLESRRQRFNDRVLEANARVEHGREALAQFNREVARYNLMLVYPDGLDEASAVAAKPALGRAGGG